ncbi:MAG: sterol desaturase family protein [Deltaproteobacteria bacterium]|nr:sterol desaturase family protein [Deltaproteobacteria bacterium]MBW2386135.1 sterol desaturase family protein [Deltaproteobacteria bacterium]
MSESARAHAFSYAPDHWTKSAREESERSKILRGLRLYFATPVFFGVTMMVLDSPVLAAALSFVFLAINQASLERSAPYLTGIEQPLGPYLLELARKNAIPLAMTVTGILAGFFALSGLLAILGVEASLVLLLPASFAPDASAAATLLWCLPVLLLADFLVYWYHRAAHASGEGLLARLHAVHHSIPYFTLAQGSRAHPLETVVTYSAYGIAGALLGVGFDSTFCAGALVLFIMSAHHVNCDDELGPFGRLLVETDAHRWHHNIDHLDSGNFSLLFAHCDRIFGTYHRPNKFSGRIGVQAFEQFFPTSPLEQLLAPLPSHWEALKARNRDPVPSDPTPNDG